MIVITMTNCPPKLRGDLSKWLYEINTGVYVGRVNAKVREALWSRVCENISEGQATLVYTASNEQHMEFRTHNSEWNIKDYDGLKLIKRPALANRNNSSPDELSKGFSKAARYQKARRINKNRNNEQYVFLDIETTGLEFGKDEIIEIGVLYEDSSGSIVKNGALIKTENPIPEGIVELTGITDDMLEKDGILLSYALEDLNKIIEGKSVVCYNSNFDISFLREAYQSVGKDFKVGRVIDVLKIAKRKITSVNYKLITLADYFKIEYENQHRALDDCEILRKVFLKLNEI